MTSSLDHTRTASVEEEKLSQDHFTDNKSTSDSDVVEKAIEAEKSIGVEKAELLAAQWSHSFWKKVLLGISAIFVNYCCGLDSNTRYMYQSYATASWSQHSLLTTLNAITGVTAAASQPVYARLSDIFGRLELFIVALLFYVVGTIIEGQSPNIHAYVAGNVLYNIGYSGIIMVLLFIMSDFSSLRWRLFFTLLPSFPYIINAWISAYVIQDVGMRWQFGISLWAYVTPLGSIPFGACLLYMRWQAGKTEEWKIFKQRKTKYQELGVFGFIKYLFWRLDIIGLLIMIVSLGCLLVPLTLASGTHGSQWNKAHIVVPLVIGGVLLPVFGVWEAYGARDPIIPFQLMKDRGVWSAAVISFLFDFVFAVESSLFTAVLVVAVNQSLFSANRIMSLSSFTAVIAGLLLGLVIVYTRRLKGFVVFGVALWLVAFGMLYHYRSSLAAKSGIIGAMVVMGIGNGFFSYSLNVLVQAAVVKHEFMAVISSAIYTAYRVGYACGSAVAGAVWTARLPEKLEQHTGNSTLALSVYGDPYTFASTYAWDSPERQQVVLAYADVQRLLMIVCLCFVAPMVIFAFFLRDPKMTREQSLENSETIEDEKSMFNFFKRKQVKEVEA